jgi:hypothetical protein
MRDQRDFQNIGKNIVAVITKERIAVEEHGRDPGDQHDTVGQRPDESFLDRKPHVERQRGDEDFHDHAGGADKCAPPFAAKQVANQVKAQATEQQSRLEKMQRELDSAKAADQSKAQATELAKRAASLNSELEEANAQRNELQTKLDQATSENTPAQSRVANTLSCRVQIISPLPPWHLMYLEALEGDRRPEQASQVLRGRLLAAWRGGGHRVSCLGGRFLRAPCRGRNAGTLMRA